MDEGSSTHSSVGQESGIGEDLHGVVVIGDELHGKRSRCRKDGLEDLW